MRRLINYPGQISFTSDFHELLQGNLQPGSTLLLRYDPDRLKPPSDYIFGDARWPIRSHLRYTPGGPIAELPLRGALTIHPDRDPMGQGSMLTGRSVVYETAKFIEIWFSGDFSDGVHWDSEYGRNYWFRFPYRDLAAVESSLDRSGEGDVQLRVIVNADPAVARLQIRFSDRASKVKVRREADLTRAGLEDNHVVWKLQEPVAKTALVAFKLYYWIDGRRFKDDNSGHYYVVEDPDSRDAIPLPEALVAATREWAAKLKKNT